MRKTTRRRLQAIIALSLIGGIMLNNVNWEEENLVDVYEKNYEETTLESRCYLEQLNRISKEKPVQQGYCEKKENLEKFRLKENWWILGKLGLTDCRIVQSEEEHIRVWRGSVYATDIACIRWKSFDVKAVSFGTISKIGEDSRLGTYLVLKQGDIEYIYWHTQTSLKVWDEINKWDVVGQINTSGISQNYHLHFETWIDWINTSSEGFVNDKSIKLKIQRGWLSKEDTDRQDTPNDKELDLNQLAYAVAMAETKNCTVWNSASRNNCFWIMQWDKKWNRSFKSYATINDSYEDFKRIWKKYYKVFPTKREAQKWTGKDRDVSWLNNVTYYYES